MLSEVIALLLGIGTGELLSASDEVERALGSLVLRFGKVAIQGTGDGVDPVIEVSVRVDLRKLKSAVGS